jgi:hypothetical protein
VPLKPNFWTDQRSPTSRSKVRCTFFGSGVFLQWGEQCQPSTGSVVSSWKPVFRSKVVNSNGNHVAVANWFPSCLRSGTSRSEHCVLILGHGRRNLFVWLASVGETSGDSVISFSFSFYGWRIGGWWWGVVRCKLLLLAERGSCLSHFSFVCSSPVVANNQNILVTIFW